VTVDAEVAAARTPADVPTVVEEPLGREALVAKQKSHQQKTNKQNTGAGKESRMTLTQQYRVPSVPGARASSLVAAAAAAAVAVAVAVVARAAAMQAQPGPAPVAAVLAAAAWAQPGVAPVVAAAVRVPAAAALAAAPAAAALAAGAMNSSAAMVVVQLRQRARGGRQPGSCLGLRPQKTSGASRRAPRPGSRRPGVASAGLRPPTTHRSCSEPGWSRPRPRC